MILTVVCIQDRNAASNTAPGRDEGNDWVLVGASENEGMTYVQLSRPISPCDDLDMEISKGTTKMIWAFHASSDLDEDESVAPALYHGTDGRGTRSVNLLSEASHEIPSSAMTAFLGSNSAPISGAWDTTYMCSGHELPADKDYLLVGYGITIAPPENKKFIHHVVVYACPMPGNTTEFVNYQGDCDRDGNIPSSIKDCKGNGMPIMTWAVGGKDIAFPPKVGLPFGPTAGDARYVVLELHYDNPGMDTAVDSSGLTYSYLDASAHTDYNLAGVFWTGSIDFMLPPNVPSYSEVGVMTSKCSTAALPAEGITIFAGGPHTHLYGTAVVGRHVVEGNETALPYAYNPHYDFNYQTYQWLPEPVHVSRGDQLQVECTYDTSSFDGGNPSVPILEGESTRHEMCLIPVLYYPRVQLTFAGTTYQWSVLIPALSAQLKTFMTPATIDAAETAYTDKLAAGYAPGDDRLESVENLAIKAFLDTAGVTWTQAQIDAWKAVMDATASTARTGVCMNDQIPVGFPFEAGSPVLDTPFVPASGPCTPRTVAPNATENATGMFSLEYPDFDIHEGPSSGAVFLNVLIVCAVFVVFTASFIAALCYFSPKEVVDEKAIELEKRRSTYMQRVASERTRSAMA